MSEEEEQSDEEEEEEEEIEAYFNSEAYKSSEAYKEAYKRERQNWAWASAMRRKGDQGESEGKRGTARESEAIDLASEVRLRPPFTPYYVCCCCCCCLLCLLLLLLLPLFVVV